MQSLRLRRRGLGGLAAARSSPPDAAASVLDAEGVPGKVVQGRWAGGKQRELLAVSQSDHHSEAVVPYNRYP